MWRADPAAIRVEQLRRKQKTAPVQPKQPAQTAVKPLKKEMEHLKPLHKEDCPLPVSLQVARGERKAAKQIATLLQNKRNLRTAIVLNEVLSKPVALRNQ